MITVGGRPEFADCPTSKSTESEIIFLMSRKVDGPLVTTLMITVGKFGKFDYIFKQNSLSLASL